MVYVKVIQQTSGLVIFPVKNGIIGLLRDIGDIPETLRILLVGVHGERDMNIRYMLYVRKTKKTHLILNQAGVSLAKHVYPAAHYECEMLIVSK